MFFLFLLFVCFFYNGDFVSRQSIEVVYKFVYWGFEGGSVRLKFFFHYTHFNESFMSKEYFSMPSYPYNPSVFRLGLAWHFYK